MGGGASAGAGATRQLAPVPLCRELAFRRPCPDVVYSMIKSVVWGGDNWAVCLIAARPPLPFFSFRSLDGSFASGGGAIAVRTRRKRGIRCFLVWSFQAWLGMGLGGDRSEG